MLAGCGEEIGALYTVGRNVKCAVNMKNRMVVPQKVKNIITMWFRYSLLGIYPKQLKARFRRDICIFMFIAALFTIAKKWKQPKCPSADEWINKMWYIHAIEYYSTLKRKEILTHATTWMNPKDNTLSETSQSQKDKYCVIPLIWGT